MPCTSTPNGAGKRLNESVSVAMSRLSSPSAGSEDRDGMGGSARATCEPERRSREEELVAALFLAGLGQTLGIGVVHEGETQHRDGHVHAHAVPRVADGTLVHHVPRDGCDVLLAEPFQAGEV